jgi:hypothetical protein
MNWISQPLSALIWIAGIAAILRFIVIGVKIQVNNTRISIERKPPPPTGKGVYLSDEEETRREHIRASRESAISPR